MLLEEFGKVVAPDGSGIVISSQSGYRMPALTAEQDEQLATTPAEELLDLDFVKAVNDTLHAYQMSKRCNSLRVRGEAITWGKRGVRVNAISPGIIITPLAHDELNGERADFYRNMLAKMPAGRAGTPDEVAALAALIMGPEGGYITGSDFLIDGGATANFFYGPEPTPRSFMSSWNARNSSDVAESGECPRNRVKSRIARRYIVCVLACSPLIRMSSRKRWRSAGTYWSVIGTSCHQIEKLPIVRQARLSTKSTVEMKRRKCLKCPYRESGFVQVLIPAVEGALTIS